MFLRNLLTTVSFYEVYRMKVVPFIYLIMSVDTQYNLNVLVTIV